MLKKRLSLKNRGLVPTTQPEPDFSRAYRFNEVINNVELITYINCHNLLMTGYKDLGKNFKITPKMGVLPICDKNWALLLLHPGALTAKN